MSREIKFRAWLIKESRMVNVNSLHHNKGYGGALEIIIDNPQFNPNQENWTEENRPCDSYLNHSMEVHKNRSGGDDFVLMQFTGLKDKNGVEIYEGDIVTANAKETEWPCRGTVEYSTLSGCYCINTGQQLFDDERDYFAHFWTHNNFEIIGNIHANPELLTTP